MSTYKQRSLHLLYIQILKPVFFLFDPEVVHDRMIGFGEFLGRFGPMRDLVSWLFNFQDPALEQKILGMVFKNPVGLAAGFDKDARLTKVLPSVGFGFVEVGSITAVPCEGNPRPRLWRLVQSRSLQVYYGLKNDGVDVILQRLRRQGSKIPLGTSIAKTNSPYVIDHQAGITDYATSFRLLADQGDYFTMNISCPNIFGGQPFTDGPSFEQLMSVIDQIPTAKPVLVKLSPDLSFSRVDELLAVAARHRVQGFIISNLTKEQDNPRIAENDISPRGGLSGKAVEELANSMLQYVWQQTRGKYVLIGCGGIFTAADAYKKIKLGASLVQLVTGMIFEGPQLIGEINSGLVELLKQDGYKNISEAVGKSLVNRQ